MTIGDQIRTAVSNVGRRKLRSTLASLGVVLAAARNHFWRKGAA